jgi:hemoglobin
MSENENNQNTPTEPTPFELIGGHEKIAELVKEFYHFMDTLPEVKTIRDQHQSDLSEAEEKLKLFLTGWLGGPQLYIEKYGHPRLRARHLPFSIGIAERDQWMLCMRKAVEKVGIPDPVNLVLTHSLARLADHMRNRQEP